MRLPRNSEGDRVGIAGCRGALLPGENADRAIEECAMRCRNCARLRRCGPTGLNCRLTWALRASTLRMSTVQLAAFGEAVKMRPQDAEAYNDLGLALVQKGDAAAAIPKFKTATQLRPEDGTLRGNLAIGYMQRADFDAAITELEAAIKLAPDNASLHYNLGLAYKLKDQLDKAVPEFQNCDPVAAGLGGCPLHARSFVLATR